MTPPILDRDHLGQYTAGDASLEAELFGLLSGQIQACLTRLDHSPSVDDWSEAMHTLKGAARGVGAMELGQACEIAEQSYLDPAALEAVKAAAQRAKQAMSAVRGQTPNGESRSA